MTIPRLTNQVYRYQFEQQCPLRLGLPRLLTDIRTETGALDSRWSCLYAEARPALYRAAGFLVGDAEGEEIVQEAFERAMKTPHFFDVVETPMGWLRQVVVRLAVSRLRRRTVWDRLKRIVGTEATSHVEGVISGAADARLDLAAAINRLSPKERGAIVLHYYFGADYREVARALGLRESSVGKTLSRARDALRADLR